MIAGVADTHAAIWFLSGDSRMSPRARQFFGNAAAERGNIVLSPIRLAPFRNRQAGTPVAPPNRDILKIRDGRIRASSVYLSLGSNIGDREAHLARALKLLQTEEMRQVSVSSTYETAPVGFLDQPHFLNLAAAFETGLTAEALLLHTSRVERQLGRQRSIVNGPRTIDIDILFFGDFVISTKNLTIPHPRFRERRFVLEPLAEIAPEFRDPVTGHTIAYLLAALDEHEA